MGKHKKVVCEKYLHVMRNDHIPRHMKQHVEGKFDQSCSSSTSLNTDHEIESDFSSVSTNWTSKILPNPNR